MHYNGWINFKSYIFFKDDELPKKYVLNLLNEESYFRAYCIRLGYNLEFAKKKRIYRELRAKGFQIPEQFNYLDDHSQDEGGNLQDSVLEDDVRADDIPFLLSSHDNDLFKRSDIATVVLEALFLEKKTQ